MIDSPCGGFVRPKIARTHKVAGSPKAELIADVSLWKRVESQLAIALIGSIMASTRRLISPLPTRAPCLVEGNHTARFIQSVSSISLRPQRPVRKHSRMVAPIN